MGVIAPQDQERIGQAISDRIFAEQAVRDQSLPAG